MTTPQQPGQPSGHTREDQAKLAARIVAAVYAAAEARIYKALAKLAIKVIKGAIRETLARRMLEQAIRRILADAETHVREALAAADRSARADTARITREDTGGPPPSAPGGAGAHAAARRPALPAPPDDAIQAVQEALGLAEPPSWDSLAVRLHQAGLVAARTADDVFAQVIAEAMAYHTGIGSKVRDLKGPERAAESLSRLQVAQKALNLFAERGITGYTDTAARRWDLASYAEMATRTAASRMHLMLQLASMAPAGQDLWIVDGPSAAMSCPKCAPWEGKVLSLGTTPNGTQVSVRNAHGAQVNAVVAGTLAEALAAGLLHPNCFPAEVVVSAPSRVRAADARWYEGDLVVIHTASGDELPVTPNHPVLTPEGWVAAGNLQKGQHVLRYSGGNERVNAPVSGVSPDDQLVPARIGDVFDALRQASTVPPVSVPGSPEQFHGDGRDSDVHVVLADGLLEHDGDSEGIGDRALIGSDAELAVLAGLGPGDQVAVGALHAPDGVMGGSGQRGALCWRHALQAAAHSLATADLDALIDEVLAQAALCDAEAGSDLTLGLPGLVPARSLGDLLGSESTLVDNPGVGESPIERVGSDTQAAGDGTDGFSSLVTTDRVTEIERRSFAGHVYNLQTEKGWYAANSLIVHNCRHSLVPFLNGAAVLPVAGGQRGFVHRGIPYYRGVIPDPESPAYKAEQRQRALERLVRKWDARIQVAVTPQALARARAGHAAAVADLEEHVKAYHLGRRPGRERAGAAR